MQEQLNNPGMPLRNSNATTYYRASCNDYVPLCSHGERYTKVHGLPVTYLLSLYPLSLYATIAIPFFYIPIPHYLSPQYPSLQYPYPITCYPFPVTQYPYPLSLPTSFYPYPSYMTLYRPGDGRQETQRDVLMYPFIMYTYHSKELIIYSYQDT